MRLYLELVEVRRCFLTVAKEDRIITPPELELHLILANHDPPHPRILHPTTAIRAPEFPEERLRVHLQFSPSSPMN